ncbi:hypothetical protein [Sphingomonas panni]|uniref:hypothetical protein n=1 Tax=Sphingomonas panni TaxID=237612 RepID=UPI001F5C0161|nr:hypothetical protein [Sphingomonas panni]
MKIGSDGISGGKIMPDVSRCRPSNGPGSRQRVLLSALLAVGLLASVPGVAPAARPEPSSLEQVLVRRRAVQARPDSDQTIETRVTAESRSCAVGSLRPAAPP